MGELDRGLENLVEEMARIPQDASEATRDRLRHLARLLLTAEAQGSTRLPQSRLGEQVPLEELFSDPALEPFLGQVGEAKPFLQDDTWITTHRLFTAEQAFAERVSARARSASRERFLAEALTQTPVRLSGEQIQAVQAALDYPITLISGNPGTGKTSIVVAILRALVRNQVPASRIALAAPTGKAAHRMREAILGALEKIQDRTPEEDRLAAEVQPRTLHRLLEWHPGQGLFRRHERRLLDCEVLIVDEGSMVGLELADRLLRALPPTAQLVILGDADQLPSVEAGVVFRDLLRVYPASARYLTHSYRMDAGDPEGRNILSVARALNSNDKRKLWEDDDCIRVRAELNEVQFRGVELLDTNEEGLRVFLEAWGQAQRQGFPAWSETLRRTWRMDAQGQWSPGEEERLETVFRHQEQARILCPLKEAKGLRGTEAINQHLHALARAQMGQGLRSELDFYLGEPVMVHVNDYEHGLFNGDQGLVLLVRKEGGDPHQMAVFPRERGFLAVPLDAIRFRLELAYALTVHKSQGSEYDRVALVLPLQDHPALSRESTYTALTRARKGVLILGSREVLEASAGRGVMRFSRMNS